MFTTLYIFFCDAALLSFVEGPPFTLQRLSEVTTQFLLLRSMLSSHAVYEVPFISLLTLHCLHISGIVGDAFPISLGSETS